MGRSLRLVTGRLEPGDLVWVNLDPIEGNEQAGTRPCVVVSSRNHLQAVPTLVSVVPVTSSDRGWESHIRLEPGRILPKASWAMTEQIRTIARERIQRGNGRVSKECLSEMLWWVRAFIADPARA